MDRKSNFNTIENISHVTGIDISVIKKIYAEIYSLHNESQNQYIKRRYSDLKSCSYSNQEIYQIISQETQFLLFKGNPISERKFKRIIYKEK